MRPAADEGRVPDALLGQRRRGRRRGPVLRPVGDRQDDALGRPGPAADRRRRARLVGRRACSTSRAAVTPRRSACRPRRSRRSTTRSGSAACWRTCRSTPARGGRTTTASGTRRTRGPPTRSTSSRTTSRPAAAGTPKTIFFLTCDAFGVMPPIARLTPEQAMEHFLCGYTAKVAGTEVGVKDPQAEFSTCFAAPFLPLPPRRYAALLGREAQAAPGPGVAVEHRLDRRGVRGGRADQPDVHAGHAAGGAGGQARRRCPTARTRSSACRCRRAVPACRARCSTRRRAWPDKAAYDRAAADLAKRFQEVLAKYK